MTAYTEGYQEGWLAYLKQCKRADTALEALLAEAHTLTKQVGHGLSNQQQSDYWLGYYHGRTAARAAVLYNHKSKN
jgi:hypothetical protein